MNRIVKTEQNCLLDFPLMRCILMLGLFNARSKGKPCLLKHFSQELLWAPGDLAGGIPGLVPLGLDT